MELDELAKEVASEQVEQSKRELADQSQLQRDINERARERAELIVSRRLGMTLKQLREQLNQEGNDDSRNNAV